MRSRTPDTGGGRGTRDNQVYASHTQPATGGEERESHRANQVECAHHTPATGGEERES